MDWINMPSTRPWRRKQHSFINSNIYSMLLFLLLALIGTTCATNQDDAKFVPTTLVLDYGPVPTANKPVLKTASILPTATKSASSSSSSSSTKDSTLSTSTIIIIAVGLGLLLVFGGAAICFMRRRRKQQMTQSIIIHTQIPINTSLNSSANSRRSSKLRVRADGYYTTPDSPISSPNAIYTSPNSPHYEMGGSNTPTSLSDTHTPVQGMPRSPYLDSAPPSPWATSPHNQPSSRSTWASYKGGKLKLETAIEEATTVELVRLTPMKPLRHTPASLRSNMSMDTFHTATSAQTWPPMNGPGGLGGLKPAPQRQEKIVEARQEHRGVTYEKGVDWV